MSASSGVSIPQLLHLFRESFSETDFNELQETLMDREENMKIEILDLKMDLASSKVDARLLESSHSLAELERSRLEIKLRRSEGKRKESDKKLEDMGVRLMKVESGLGDIINVRVKDLASLTDFMDKTAVLGERVDLPDMIKGWKDSLGDGCTNADAQNVAVVVGTAFDATESDDTPLVMEGGIKEVGSWEEVSRGIHDSLSELISSGQDSGWGKATNPIVIDDPPGIVAAPLTAIAASTSFPKWYRRPADRMEEDLETKKRRVLAGGADAGPVHTCDVCNVVCKSVSAFNSHLAGPKHASMIRRRAYNAGE